MVGMIVGGGPVGGGGNPGGGTVMGNPTTKEDQVSILKTIKGSFRLKIKCCVSYWVEG